MFQVKKIGRYFRVFYQGNKRSQPFFHERDANSHAKELAAEFYAKRREALLAKQSDSYIPSPLEPLSESTPNESILEQTSEEIISEKAVSVDENPEIILEEVSVAVTKSRGRPKSITSKKKSQKKVKTKNAKSSKKKS